MEASGAVRLNGRAPPSGMERKIQAALKKQLKG
eukprot:CAMPEP_0180417280 /NCGR_PEP_ID=MMETSP1036_2-20121128/945_1 /TAXON_ID=632150 /ORGANISM="Azadinium spinosum, Strain 3D9" /LENGTH=32 /DNA_ID= /DNA_START= /DNA_END= /DNA_ORIENTATION=